MSNYLELAQLAAILATRARALHPEQDEGEAAKQAGWDAKNLMEAASRLKYRAAKRRNQPGAIRWDDYKIRDKLDWQEVDTIAAKYGATFKREGENTNCLIGKLYWENGPQPHPEVAGWSILGRQQ